MTTLYSGPIATAITELSRAIFTAEMLVPQSLRALHWRLSKSTPCAWEEVCLHAKADGASDELLTALLALKEATMCRDKLQQVLDEVDALGKEKPVFDLKVKRIREQGHGKYTSHTE